MATSVISNTVIDPSGNPVPFATVVATLVVPAFLTATGIEVATQVTTTANASGVWSLALERNADLTPAGTYYIIDQLLPAGTRSYAIQVGATDQSLIASLVSPIPVPSTTVYLTQ